MESKGNGKQPVSVAMTDERILAEAYGIGHYLGSGCYSFSKEEVVRFARALLSSASSQDAIRNAALEDAAKVCDNWQYQDSNKAQLCATQIRALQSAPAQNGERPDAADYPLGCKCCGGMGCDACNYQDCAAIAANQPQQAAEVRGNVQEPITWLEAERISELPGVDEAIRNFAADRTQDNATGMVLAVLAAAPQVAQEEGARKTYYCPECGVMEGYRHRLCTRPELVVTAPQSDAQQSSEKGFPALK